MFNFWRKPPQKSKPDPALLPQLGDNRTQYDEKVEHRNPKRPRFIERNVTSDYDDAYCRTCGVNLRCIGVGGFNLCKHCHGHLVAAQQPRSGYQLPPGITEFSPQLWIDQMCIMLDLEEGIISMEQAALERELVVRLEKQRLNDEVEKKRQQAAAAVAAQKRLDAISAAAGKLLK